MKVVAILGPADPAVLRVACGLGEVTALAVSPDSTSLSLAAGVKQRVQIWDDALSTLPSAGADREAILATVLAAARHLDAQLFVVAETSVGYLGSAIAEQLNLAHLSQVVAAAIVDGDSENLQLRVSRRCLHGIQRLRGPAAGVLCVLPTASDLAAPDKKAAAGGGSDEEAAPADDRQIDRQIDRIWSLANIGLVKAELPRPLVRPVVPAQHTRFAPRRFDNLDQLVARLRQDGLG